MSSPYYCYKHPRFAVTVDLVAFAWVEGALRVLLIRRKHDPFAGCWALPGGFLERDEPADAGARRELREETGLVVDGPLAPIGFYDKPGRDPRGRTITLAHAAVVPFGEHAIRGGDDAAEAAWKRVDEPLDLAFDHREILAVAKDWLRRELLGGSLGATLLPAPIALADVRTLFRILGIPPRSAQARASRWSIIDSR
jgi:8-oxo-dGTP diphosphatase